jgi:hypothetical protein
VTEFIRGPDKKIDLTLFKSTIKERVSVLLFSRKALFYCLLLSFVFMAFAGCAGNGSPRAVVDNYIKSIKEKNYKKAWALLSEKTRGGSDEEESPGFKRFKEDWEGSMKEAALKEQIMSSRTTKENLQEDRATVTIMFTKEQVSKGKEPPQKKEVTQDLQTVREKGKWKIEL